MKEIILILTLIAIAIGVQLITLLPWWFFLFVTFSSAYIMPNVSLKIPIFMVGFIVGFVSWLGPFAFFHFIYEGDIVTPIAEIIGIYNIILLLIIGVMGGLINALAFYSGYLLRRGKQVIEFPTKLN